MTRYYSDDGVFDAPIERVWELIAAHDDARVKSIHPATASQRTLEDHGAWCIREIGTRGPDGNVLLSRIKFTFTRPIAQSLEFLSGPMIGTWETTTYVPEGNRTRLVTVGEARMSGAPDEAALQALASFVDHAHEEDKAYLKRMGERS